MLRDVVGLSVLVPFRRDLQTPTGGCARVTVYSVEPSNGRVPCV
jgi:hypothetical protein